MLSHEGMNLVRLDSQSSTPATPYGILTIDCSNPHEIDDGVFVERLDTDTEQYRVGVCVVDASELNHDQELVSQAMKNVEAKYYPLNDNEHGYDPMIDTAVIHDVDFRKDMIRKAMIVSFNIGRQEAPYDVDVSFGNVEVRDNLSYATMIRRCQHDPEQDGPIAMASAMIMRHLRYNSGGDSDDVILRGFTKGGVDEINRRIIFGKKNTLWSRGSRMNEAFMVGAGHLVGKMLAEEGRPAIYRVHDPADETFLDFLPPDMATYSRMPGVHTGLSLTPYCRVTSPLRRLEDFRMHHQLRRRAKGMSPTQSDEHVIAATIQRLNAHIVQRAASRVQPLSRRDTLGRAGTKLKNVAQLGSTETQTAIDEIA